jgi:hypothetical protein
VARVVQVMRVVIGCFLAVFFWVSPVTCLAATTYEMSDPDSWNQRIDGQAWHDHIPDRVLRVADLDDDGINDYIFGSIGSDYGGGHTGSLFIVNGTLLPSVGIGKTWDLFGSTKFSLRIDHFTDDSYFPYGLEVTDFDDDGKPDIVVGDPTDGAFIILNDKLINYLGVGNTRSLANSSSYSVKISGVGTGMLSVGDFDGNDRPDIAIGEWGKAYVIFNEKFSELASGTTLSLADSDNYDLLIDKPVAGDAFGYVLRVLGDIDGDGKDDLGVGSRGGDSGNGAGAGSLYLFSGNLLTGYKSSGSSINVGNTSVFNVRIDGSAAWDYLAMINFGSGDVDADGKRDLIVGASGVNSWTGVDYLFCGNSLASKLATTGNIVETSVASNYNVRFDGINENDNFGDYVVESADINNDGKDDMVLGASMTDRRGEGEVYVIYGAASYCSGVGVSRDMSDSANYNVKYSGVDTTDLGGIPGASLQDVDLDGSIDILVGAFMTGYNSREESGSLYTILNFPHTIDVEAVSNNQPLSTVVLTGSVGATNSVTNISGVQYRVDSNQLTGTWSACTADDGAFDSRLEDYSCEISGLANGSHTVYVRAYDENISYTVRGNFASTTFTVLAPTPDITNVGTSSLDTGVTITWVTEEAASSQVYYGLTSGYGTTTTVTDTSPLVTNHRVSLSLLQPCAIYHYQAKSVDSEGNEKFSSDGTFSTTGCTVAAASESMFDKVITDISGGEVPKQFVDSQGNNLGISLTIPASSIGVSEASFQIQQFNKFTTFSLIPSPPDYNPVSGYIYELRAFDLATTEAVGSFSQPLGISINYNQSDLGNDIDESTLTIYRYHDAAWSQLSSCQINTGLRRVTCSTTGFSLFVLVGKNKVVSAANLTPECGDPKPFSAPDLFEVYTFATSATMKFTPINNTSQFYISFSSVNTNGEEHGEQVTLGREGEQNHTVYHLKPNTVYYFKVRGQLGCQPGEWSKILTAKTTTGKRTARYYPNSLILKPKVMVSSNSAKTSSVLGAQSPTLEVEVEPTLTPIPTVSVPPKPTPSASVTPTPKSCFRFLWWCW